MARYTKLTIKRWHSAWSPLQCLCICYLGVSSRAVHNICLSLEVLCEQQMFPLANLIRFISYIINQNMSSVFGGHLKF